MLELEFQAVEELEVGPKWESLFKKYWPAYQSWYNSKGAFHSLSVSESEKQLKAYMPELMPLYNKLIEKASKHANENEVRRMMSGYNPPAYISGCSQALTFNPPQLVRNYDYHPHLSEGLQLLSKWNDKKVIAMSDSLWGAVDGMNDHGLVVSLTFGGKKEIGKGFGIPIILRYVLEIANDIETAIEMLSSVPSTMAYNIALLDADGNSKIVEVAPDTKAKVVNRHYSTNHQGEVSWEEHANFSKTIERADYLNQLLNQDKLNNVKVIEAFLEPPLYNRQFSAGFGTVFTSVYNPDMGVACILWEDDQLIQTFENFVELKKKIIYSEDPVEATTDTSTSELNYQLDDKAYDGYSYDWKALMEQYIPKEVATFIVPQSLEQKGDIPWEKLADYWKQYGVKK